MFDESSARLMIMYSWVMAGTGCGEDHISGSLVVSRNFQDPEVGGVGDGCGGN